MAMQRRLISLIGTLVVIIALTTSTLLVALPVYMESRDIKNQEAQVAASNQILVARIDALRAQEAELPQIQAELGELRAELPHIPQLDDVVKLALRAAADVDGTVLGVEFSAPTGFKPRAPEDVLTGLPDSAVGVTASSPPAENTESSEPSTADPAGDAPKPERTADAERLQIPVTITVTAATTTAAARFLDELREGPRLLQIDTTTGVLDAETDQVNLTVTGLVFVQVK